MKKLIIVLVLALVVLTSAFSNNTSLGVAVNYINTSVIVDTESERFGFEGSLGFPLVSAVLGTLDSVSNGKDFKFVELLLPGIMVNPYFKVIDGNRFQFRIGLQEDILVFFDKGSVSAAGLLGASLGMNYKFNEKFGMNLTAGIPVALPLSIVSEEAASWTLFYLSSKEIDKSDIAKIIFGGLGCAMNQFLRISCKWAL
jgi:hypothetical protein